MKWSKEHIIFSLENVIKQIEKGASFDFHQKNDYHIGESLEIENHSNICINISKNCVRMTLTSLSGEFNFSRLFWKDREVKVVINKLRQIAEKNILEAYLKGELIDRERQSIRAQEALFKTFQHDMFEKEILGDPDGKEE